MRAKVARRLLKEQDTLQRKAAEAEERRVEAVAETDRLLSAAHLVDLEYVDAELRLKDVAERQAELDRLRTETLARRAFWTAEQRDARARAEEAAGEANERRRVAEALAAKARDPRFADAEAVLRQVEARRAEGAARVGAPTAPLSPETIEGLKLLRRAFDPKGIKRPSHRVVQEDGSEFEVLEPRGQGVNKENEFVVDVSTPCPECGAKAGEPCKVDVKHHYEEDE